MGIFTFQDECSFVSLRDVERTLQVMMWFYAKGELLFQLMDEKRKLKARLLMDEEDEEEEENLTSNVSSGVHVCARACVFESFLFRIVVCNCLVCVLFIMLRLLCSQYC